MDGIPRLNIQYPDYGNVLARGAAIKGQEARNALTQVQSRDYPEERNWLRKERAMKLEDREIAAKQRDVQQYAAAMDAALKTKSPEMAMQVFNAMKPEKSQKMFDFSLNKEQEEVTIIYADGSSLSGKVADVAEGSAQIAQDPTWVTDSEKIRHFAAWSAARGIKFTAAEKEEEDKLISVTAGARLAHPKTGKVTLEAKFKPDTGKTGANYLLKDRSMVTSFDGGRTFRNESGKDIKMPFDAVKINTTISGQELAMYDAQTQAQSELDKDGGVVQAGDMAKVAEGGTGPFAMAAASVDAVLGGLGVDRLFGAKGLFSNTQENRQVLRTIKQLGKSALMISSRGAIYEQKLLDKLFPDPDKAITNPRTEAKKFETLRKLLAQEREFNLEAIVSGVTPKEVSELRNANTQIDRLLSLIGTGEPADGGPQIGAVEEGYTFKGGDPADPNSWEKVE